MCRHPYKHKQVGHWARTFIIGNKPCLFSRRMTVNVAIPLFIKVVILMMKLKYSICCGLDVHKNVIVATIVITNKDGISEYRQKSFSTINSDIQRFHNWLIENNCYHVCMESTGKYWIPNGLPTSTNLILSDVPLFLQKISVSSGNFPDTASS